MSDVGVMTSVPPALTQSMMFATSCSPTYRAPGMTSTFTSLSTPSAIRFDDANPTGASSRTAAP